MAYQSVTQTGTVIDVSTTQISVRLPDELVAHIDAEVGAGHAPSRASYLHRALEAARRRDIYAREIELLEATKHESDPDLDSFTSWAAGRSYPDLDS
jgi:Arc/MetJ-type ribon-helix-helix transcriptional regulator